MDKRYTGLIVIIILGGGTTICSANNVLVPTTVTGPNQYYQHNFQDSIMFVPQVGESE